MITFTRPARAALACQNIRMELSRQEVARFIAAAAVVLPPAPGSTANHRKLHRLAAAAGAWRCHYCGRPLYDDCYTEGESCDIPTRRERHHGPAAGSHGIEPAVIHHAPGVVACSGCVTRTVTRRKAAA